MVSFELGKEVKKDVFSLVTSSGQRKTSESPWGIKPQNFGFCSLMLYHWVTESLWWVRSILKFLSWFLMGTQILSHAPNKTKTSFSSSTEILKGAAVCSTTQVWKFFKYKCCHSNLSLSSYVTFWLTVVLWYLHCKAMICFQGLLLLASDNMITNLYQFSALELKENSLCEHKCFWLIAFWDMRRWIQWVFF